MTPYETIRLVAKCLVEGQSERVKCPWCHGGKGQESSFIITRTAGSAKYICHRATCNGNSRGYLSISGAPTALPKPRIKPKPAEFTSRTYKPSTYVQQVIESKYQISSQAIEYYGIKQTSGNDIVVPIYSDRGTQQGTLVRLDTIVKGTKALTYHTESSDGMAWFTGKPEYIIDNTLIDGAHLYKDYIDECLVLVEDMYSAIKANYFMDSIALLGVGFNSEQAAKVAHKEYRRVLLALDADASAKAVAIATRVRVILPNLRVVLLTKDLKDMPYNTLGTFLSENYRRR